jgi:hypothetical protein
VNANVNRCTGSTSTEVTSAGVPYWVSSNDGRSFGSKRFTGSWFNGSDSDVAVDRVSGDVYVADGPFPDANPHTTICRSADHGHSWTTVFSGAESCAEPITLTGQVAPNQDRPWINFRPPSAAHPHRDLFLTVLAPMPVADAGVLHTAVYRSRDGGPFIPIAFPWTEPAYLTETGDDVNIANSHPVLGRNGDLYMTWVTGSRQNLNAAAELWFARLHDPGDADQAWTLTKVLDANAVVRNAPINTDFPLIAVDGGGGLYIVLIGDITGAGPFGKGYLWSSADGGRHWRGPTKLNKDGKARALAAIHGGPAQGDLVIGWYRSLTGPDPADAHSKWIYDVTETHNAAAAAPTFTTAHVNHGAVVHRGFIAVGTVGRSNLYDFSSITVDHRGCAIATYTDDHRVAADQSNTRWDLIDNVVVRQTTGCF